MRLKMALAALLWLICASLSALSADETYQDGKRAYQHDDYATALQIWRPLADQGQADAENGMGLLYHLGLAVTKDCKAARQWYERASAHGSFKAEYNLGILYKTGCGVGPDTATALRHFLKSADGGVPEAQVTVGYGYLHGDDPYPRDYEKARDYLHRAAVQGNAHGQHMLGEIYAFGIGVKEDPVIGYAWLSLAAEQATAEAKSEIDKDLDSLASRSTPGQIAQARRIALRCRTSGYQNCTR